MTSTFMPEADEYVKSEKNYWRPAQFKEGDNRLRIVSRPIAGWLDWKDKKPYRFRPDAKPKTSFDPAQPMKAFWTLHVWDYARSDLYVLEVTQASIIKSLRMYGSDPDWGDFTTYDVKIRKEGSGKDTNYFVTPMPHKPLSQEITDMLIHKPVRLEALYDSGDPWDDLEESQSIDDLFPIDKPTTLSEQQHAILDSYISDDSKAIELIKKRFNLMSVYDLKPEDFDPIIEWLKQRKGATNGKARVA